MSMPPRDRLSATPLPPAFRTEVVVSAEQVVAAVGISPQRLARLIALGLIEPADPGANAFTAESVRRLAHMRRLHQELGVRWVAASIIVDLVERIDALEARRPNPRG